MSERGKFNSEQEMVYGRLRGFFGRAESDFPAAAKQLVNVVGGLVGEQQTTRRELQAGMGNIDVGLALIGDWLKETGAEGFDVKLGLGGGTKKAIGRSLVNFPTASDLIRVGGRVDSELQKQIPPLLSSFSRQIRGGLDVGLSPREIIGGLVAESVGSRLSADGSAVLREALNKPLGGHFEWIRDALGIGDVAARELAGRIQKEAMIGEVKADLPALLQVDETGEYILPEGYELLDLPPIGEQLIELGEAPGSEMICYAGRVGIRLKRGKREVFFSLLGLDLPESINPDVEGSDSVELTNIDSDGIPLAKNDTEKIYLLADSDFDKLQAVGGYKSVSLGLPLSWEEADFGVIGPDFMINDKGNIVIENGSFLDKMKITLPVTVAPASRGEKLAAEKRQEIQRRAAERGAEPAESKTENWEGAVKKLIEDPFAQIAYEQTQSVMAAAAAFSLNAEISNGLVGEDQFIGLVKRIAALSQNMRPKKAQPRLLPQWPAYQRLFLEDEISRTAYEATESIVAAAAAFSLREEIMAGTIAEEKFVPFVREVATLVQKTKSQIKH